MRTGPSKPSALARTRCSTPRSRAGSAHLDAARSYGRAEEFLGSWLREREPAGGDVSSKWGYVYTAGWGVDADPPEVKHHDVETFRRQLAETREQLGDWLALYRSTRRRPRAACWRTSAVLDELARLRETGVRIGSA